MKKLFLLLIPLTFIGCCTPKEIIREVPVEVVHDVYHNVYIHDTTHTTDSTFIYQKGDTVFIDKLKKVYIERIVHDTLKTHDTIPQSIVVTEVKTVKEPQWWPVWLMLGVIVAGVIVYIIFKFKTKLTPILKLFK